MKFDTAGDIEELVWDLRLSDLPRGQNRNELNWLFNGNPPYPKDKAEENNIQVNRNFLDGPNLLSQGRGRWNKAFLKQQNYFGVTVDSGAAFKRQEYGHIITRNINRQLKKCRGQMEQIRAEGANVMLHGIGPSMFKDRRCPILSALPVSSLLIPDETDIDFENLEYFSVFREWTPYQLYLMTHGPKTDPGWNMDAVNAQWEYIREQVQKEPNATAFQYMPERIEELSKQGGIWGTDAVPTCDVWDFYFREAKDGDGWYRRIILDWGVAVTTESTGKPESRNTSKEKGGFLYTSGKRKFSNCLGEILQCQFGDCSAVAPFKYHSVRGLGWMLWGVCELENRLRCRFTENVFMSLLWWFRCASDGEFDRVKKAMFEHMGVIPAGIKMLTADERFHPPMDLMELAFDKNRQSMSESAGSFIGNPSDIGKEETATGTMARVHSVNAMMGDVLTLAYEYSKYKYQEQCRRFCIKNSPYKMVRDFRRDCLRDGLPEEMLDSSRWSVEPDRALGDGNKILEMAIAQGLENIRKNATPDGQRKIDHLYTTALTDRPDLAEELFPIEGQQKISPSQHDAQLATDRILRGLPFTIPTEGVPEDYVITWLGDMAGIIKQVQAAGNVGTMEQVLGLANMGKHIGEAIAMMESGLTKEPGHTGKHGDADAQHKIRQYKDALGKLMNLVRAFAQRLQEKAKAGNGNGQPDPEAVAKIQNDRLKAMSNLKNKNDAHALKLQHKAQDFALDQKLKAGETMAEIRREDTKAAQELVHNRLKHLLE